MMSAFYKQDVARLSYGEKVMTSRRLRLGVAALVLLAVLAGTLVMRWHQSPPALRIVALAGYPGSVAVDTRTGDAFVATADPGGHENRVSMYDMATGALLHSVALGGSPVAVALDEPAARVFVTSDRGDGGGRIHILDAGDAHVLGTVVVHRDPAGAADAVAGAVAVDTQAGRAFVASYLPAEGFRGLVSVLDVRGGQLLRTVAVGLRPQLVAVCERTGRVFVVNSGSSSVSMLDTRSGAIVHTTALPATPVAAVVDERSKRVFVGTATSPDGSGAGAISALDAASGAVLYTTSLNGAAAAIAVGAPGGQVVVANGAAGLVSVLDARTGGILRTIPMAQSPVVLAATEHGGEVIVGTRNLTTDIPTPAGSVRLLDVRSGIVPRTLLTGVTPVAVAVDARAGRAIVLNFGGTVREPDTWSWIPAWLRRFTPFLPPPGDRVRTVPGSAALIDLSHDAAV